MKTKFNQKATRTGLKKISVCLFFFIALLSAWGTSGSQNTCKELSAIEIRLPTNATSTDIQKALDQLPASGGVVYLPSGTCTVTQPIVLQRDNQSLRGAGITTVLRLAPGANCPVIIMGEPVNSPKYNVKNLCVSGLQIDGNRRGQTRELWKLSGEGSEIRNNGITIQRVSNSLVDNVICARCRSGGLVTTLDVRYLTVRKLTAFDNQFDGLACYETRHSTFSDLYLHDNPGAGISLDLEFDDNSISNAFLLANNLGVFMRASCDNQFFNITIQDSHHFGVFMAGHLDQNAATRCADNAFTNLTAIDCGGPAFRVNNVTCTNNLLIRAKFSRDLKGGLSLARPNLVTVE